jgi:hypothetical protein
VFEELSREEVRKKLKYPIYSQTVGLSVYE